MLQSSEIDVGGGGFEEDNDRNGNRLWFFLKKTTFRETSYFITANLQKKIPSYSLHRQCLHMLQSSFFFNVLKLPVSILFFKYTSKINKQKRFLAGKRSWGRRENKSIILVTF